MPEPSQVEQGAERPASLRRRLYLELEPAARTRKGLSPLNLVLAWLIVASVAGAVLETEPAITRGREAIFGVLELVFTAVFAVEYLARLWIAVENPRCGGGWQGRLRYALTPAALTDLAVVVVSVVGAFGAPAFLLRLVRLARILRLAKLGRMSSAWNLFAEAIASRRYELLLTTGIAGVVVLVSSTVLYLVEGEAQPAQFGSVPRAMWWSIVTLTTIGYGDVYPSTVLGRIFAGATAVMAIGIIAAPTGILAAAFSEAVRRRRESEGETVE
jgi:voltage-gated potassium channel